MTTAADRVVTLGGEQALPPQAGEGQVLPSIGVLEDPVRRAAVERLLGNGGRSPALDRLTVLAATLLEAPHAQVSLLAAEQHVASLVTSAAPLAPVAPSPLSGSLCSVTVSLDGPLVVSDAAVDDRVRTLPPVTSGSVRGYLGVPLRDRHGLLLGALCVYDPEPRTWSARDVGVLGELSPAVVAELELRAVTLEVATAAARLDLALGAAEIGSFEWDMTTDELLWDDRLIALFGYDRESFRSDLESFRVRLHPDDRDHVLGALARAADTGEFAETYRIVRPDGEIRWVDARGRLVQTGSGGGQRMLGAAYDVTARRQVDEERERAYRDREQAVVERERAYAQAEAANTRLRLLVDVTSRLGASLEPAEVLSTLAAAIVPAMGRWAVVAVPGDVAAELVPGSSVSAADALVPVVVRHSDPEGEPGLTALMHSLPLSLDDQHGVGAVLRTGEPEWLPEVTDDVIASFGFDESTREQVQGLQVGRALTVPLLSRGRRLAAITVAEPLTGALDRALLLDIAGRAAVALDNALLYRAERRTGITLQRSLLPRDVPVLPRLEVAHRYLPGDDGAFVGGDWFQGVVVQDRLVLAMGDVMGHGMRSAARMGQLRAIVATLALEGHAPGALLERLAASTDVLLDVELATLLVARLDPASGELAVASAGHPPALLAVPGEPARFLDVEPGPPLGTFAGEYRESVCQVPAGSTLLLYTDGLVEDRGEALGAGLERLRGALADAARPADEVADHVLEATGRLGGADDDIALLVVRRT